MAPNKHGRADGDVRVVDVEDGRTLTSEDIATLRELAARYRTLKWLVVGGMALVGLLGLDKLSAFVGAHWG